MKTILQRKDNTSICCTSINQHHNIYPTKTKVIGFTVACTMLVIGLFLIIMTI